MTKEEESAKEGDCCEREKTQWYYDRFRQLSREFVEYLLTHFPQSANDDWQCQCYQSFGAFRARYPALSAQRQIVRRLAHSRRRLRELSPALDLLVEWTEEHNAFENFEPDSAAE